MIALNLQHLSIQELRKRRRRASRRRWEAKNLKHRAAYARERLRKMTAEQRAAYADRKKELESIRLSDPAKAARAKRIASERRTRWMVERPIIYMLKVKRGNARDLGLEFDLTAEDISIPEFCPILGIRLQRGRGRPQDSSPSIDRLDPTLGYVKGNIRIISNRANRIRNNASAAELKAVAAYAESIEADIARGKK